MKTSTLNAAAPPALFIGVRTQRDFALADQSIQCHTEVVGHVQLIHCTLYYARQRNTRSNYSTARPDSSLPLTATFSLILIIAGLPHSLVFSTTLPVVPFRALHHLADPPTYAFTFLLAVAQ
jgi:hypothetical protein